MSQQEKTSKSPPPVPLNDIFAAPWKWSEDGCQLIDAKGRLVLEIRPISTEATQEEFDLIAAAPELLAALEVAWNQLRAVSSIIGEISNNRAWDDVRDGCRSAASDSCAAIAKAKDGAA